MTERWDHSQIHLLAHANPASKDLGRLGFESLDQYFDAIGSALPAPFRLTFDRELFAAREDELNGGRTDDVRRARDVSEALADPDTIALVAVNGGAWFTRILPAIDFDCLTRRASPLWVFGFSEMTPLVNRVASYARGRGVYWLCPNYLAWKLQPDRARQEFERFWRSLPAWFGRADRRTRAPRSSAIEVGGETGYAATWPESGFVRAKLVRGAAPASGRIRFWGGCLSVLAALVGAPWVRRLRLRGRWLFLEDVNESPYRVDRCLAALKLAGWFERIEGVLLGDFHSGSTDYTDAVVRLLDYHAPREMPVMRTHEVGHVWPMSAMPVNRWLPVTVRGDEAIIETGGVRRPVNDAPDSYPDPSFPRPASIAAE